MIEVNATQRKWPSIGKYIGSQNPGPDCDLLDMPVQGDTEEVKCFLYQMQYRIYGDEIELAKDRIFNQRNKVKFWEIQEKIVKNLELIHYEVAIHDFMEAELKHDGIYQM